MLRLLFTLIVNLFLLPFVPWRLWRRRRAAPKDAWVQLYIPGRLTEITWPRRRRLRFLNVFGRRQKPPVSLERLRELCDELKADPRPHGLLVELEPLQTGFASAQALSDALASVKAAGKHVHVHLPKGGGLRDYFVATAASSVSMPAHASLHLVGLGAKSLYFKDALQAVGVQADVEQRYEFKSAGETFARAGMSETARAQADRLLSELERQVYGAIAERRPKATASVLSQGPYRAAEAKELGLLEHSIDFATTFEDVVGDKRLQTSAPRYLGRRRARMLRPFRRQQRIAVVRVSGTIVDESNVPGQASAEAVCAALEAAADARRVAAVVLLVDSRGGSAFASAEIHRGLIALKKKKPVVAYFADYAASGGYYVAAHANEIWSNPLCVTGSIGVISVRPVIDDLLARLHIGKDGVTRGVHSGLLDATGRWSDAEQAAMRRQIDATYAEFTDVVAQGRKLDAQAVDALARGRVFLGSEAPALKLVDGIGSFRQAVERAKALVGRPVAKELVLFGAPRLGLSGLFAELGGSETWLAAGSSLLHRLIMRDAMAYEPLEIEG